MNATSLNRNFSILKQSLTAIIGNTGYFVKIVCLIVIIGYGLSFSEYAVDVLSVTPGYILPPRFWLWTAFTHCFLEIRLWQVCVDLVTLGLCGKLIEPLWGNYEMVFFFLLVNVCVAFISALFYLIIYMITFNTDVLFLVHIQGMAGYIAGLSVAVKQIMPDHVLIHTRTPLGKITNRHIPLLLFVTSCLLYICHLLEGLYATMIGCGVAVSWVYLRFYQLHSNGSRGDLADTFKFSSIEFTCFNIFLVRILIFFPTVLQPPVQVVADWIFSCFVKLKICRKAVRRYDVGAPTSISISLPGMDPILRKTKIQKALKLLTERLNQQQTESGESWPTMEENQSLLSGGMSDFQAPTHSSNAGSSSSSTLQKQHKTVTLSLPLDSNAVLPTASVSANSQHNRTAITSLYR
ncbi:Transmembrane protein [Armadillidium vulgare]|nr:Transmembrane protein [Armadillidium vulgare]